MAEACLLMQYPGFEELHMVSAHIPKDSSPHDTANCKGGCNVQSRLTHGVPGSGPDVHPREPHFPSSLASWLWVKLAWWRTGGQEQVRSPGSIPPLCVSCISSITLAPARQPLPPRSWLSQHVALVLLAFPLFL